MHKGQNGTVTRSEWDVKSVVSSANDKMAPSKDRGHTVSTIKDLILSLVAHQ